MKRPTLQRIELSAEEAAYALHVLETMWVTPDGEELIDRHAVARCRRQIEAGCYHRLVWPEGTTMADAIEWAKHAREILEWRKLGLV